MKNFALYIFIALCTFSCSLKNNGAYQTITVSLPHDLSKSQALASQPPKAGSHTAAPTSLSAFNCYAVNIIGPGMPADPRLACGDPTQGLGAFAGFVSSTTPNLTIQVPNGAARQISLIGTVQSGACPDLNTLLNSQNGGGSGNNVNPYLLATTTVDVFSDVSVNLTAAYDPNNPTPYLQGCGGNGPQYAASSGYTGHIINNSFGIVGAGTTTPSDPSVGASDIFGSAVSGSLLTSIFGASLTNGSTPVINSSVMGYSAETSSGYQSAVSRLIWDASDFNLSTFPYGQVQMSLAGGMDATCPAQTSGFGVTAYVFAPTNPYPATNNFSSGTWMPFVQTISTISPQWTGGSGNLPLPISDLLVTGSSVTHPYLIVEVVSDFGSNSSTTVCKSAAYIGAATLQLQKSGTANGGSTLYVSSNAPSGINGYTIGSGTNVQFFASGGTPPYSFSDSSFGAINHTTGAFNTSSTGTETVYAMDAKGLTGQAQVDVQSLGTTTPLGVALLSPEGSFLASTCDEFTVTTLGIGGGSSTAPTASSSNLTTLVSSLNGVNTGYWSTGSCSGSSPSATATVNYPSNSSGNVYYKQSIAGTYFIGLGTPSGGGINSLLNSGNAYVTVLPGAGGKYAFNGPLSHSPGGICTPYTLTTSDANGNPTGYASAITANFASAATGVFFGDSGCTSTDLSGTLITLTPPNTTTAASQTVYIKSGSAVTNSFDSSNLVGFANGTCPVTTSDQVATSGAPIQLQVTQVTSSISGGGQCVALNINAVDGAGAQQNIASSPEPLFVYVTGGSQGGGTSVYPSSNCTGTQSNSINLPASSSTVPISFIAYGSSPQSLKVVVSDEGTGGCSGGTNLGRVTKTISW